MRFFHELLENIYIYCYNVNMLIQFTTKNFRSIKDELTLSLEAEGLKTGDVATIKAGNNNLLPVAAIFGKNASGKSNIFMAVDWMKWAIINPNFLAQPITDHAMLQPFLLDRSTRKKPSFFQIVVWDRVNSAEYRYGFEVSKKEVVSEWLEVSSRVKTNFRKRMVFTRDFQTFEFSSQEDKKQLKPLAGRVIPGALAINVFAQFNVTHAFRFVDIIAKELVTLDGTLDIAPHTLQRCENDPLYAKKILKFLQGADLTIGDISIEHKLVEGKELDALPPQFRLMGKPERVDVSTRHRVYGSDDFEDFNLVLHESLGTRRLFGFASVVIDVLENGSTMLVDEFGSSLHPFMSMAIVRMFNSKRSNPKGAQLIVCSHETYLLTRKTGLRRDQIWFTDKNSREATTLRSLAEYKTRNDYEIAKNYLEGRFGALPYLKFE